MPVDPSLDQLSREELVARARALGVRRPEVMTRVELRDEIVRLGESDPAARRASRGWLGVARDLVASVMDAGLNLPGAAAAIRGDARPAEQTSGPPPVATVTLAEIYLAQGHADRALAVLDEVLVTEPEHAAARALRARILEAGDVAPNAVRSPFAARDEEPPASGGSPVAAEPTSQSATPAREAAAPAAPAERGAAAQAEVSREAERREAEQREAEGREAEQREAERREAERREAERRDTALVSPPLVVEMAPEATAASVVELAPEATASPVVVDVAAALEPAPEAPPAAAEGAPPPAEPAPAPVWAPHAAEPTPVAEPPLPAPAPALESAPPSAPIPTLAAPSPVPFVGGEPTVACALSQRGSAVEGRFQVAAGTRGALLRVAWFVPQPSGPLEGSLDVPLEFGQRSVTLPALDPSAHVRAALGVETEGAFQPLAVAWVYRQTEAGLSVEFAAPGPEPVELRPTA